GGADIAKGRVWQGTKEVAKGALETATLPGSFIAPEAGEVVAQGAGKASRSISRLVSEKGVTQETASQLHSALDDVASKAGIEKSVSESLSGKAVEMADALKARAQTTYKALDDASGG